MVIADLIDLRTEFEWIPTISGAGRFGTDTDLTKCLESASKNYNILTKGNWDKVTNPLPPEKMDAFWRIFWKQYEYREAIAKRQKMETPIGLLLTKAIMDITTKKNKTITANPDGSAPY